MTLMGLLQVSNPIKTRNKLTPNAALEDMDKLELLLYTTLGCHLCDDAEAVIKSCLNPEYIELVKVEIADSDALVESYGTRIPVVGVEGESAELNWPFDQPALIEFLTPFFE